MRGRAILIGLKPLPSMGRGWGGVNLRGPLVRMEALTPTQPSPIKGEGYAVARG